MPAASAKTKQKLERKNALEESLESLESLEESANAAFAKSKQSNEQKRKQDKTEQSPPTTPSEEMIELLRKQVTHLRNIEFGLAVIMVNIGVPSLIGAIIAALYYLSEGGY